MKFIFVFLFLAWLNSLIISYLPFPAIFGSTLLFRVLESEETSEDTLICEVLVLVEDMVDLACLFVRLTALGR